MKLPGIIFEGPPVDPAGLTGLPQAYRALLARLNGFIAFRGGLHVRGVCAGPAWHSLAAIQSGEDALHKLFPAIRPDDVCFGQDCLGDQFFLRTRFLRDPVVYRLFGESGELKNLKLNFDDFLRKAVESPVEFLGLQPLLRFEAEGGRLSPDQLLSAYPPFVFNESGQGVLLRAIPKLERIGFLACMARQLADVPDGGSVRIVIKD